MPQRLSIASIEGEAAHQRGEGRPAGSTRLPAPWRPRFPRKSVTNAIFCGIRLPTEPSAWR
jgi:hypothetical protein